MQKRTELGAFLRSRRARLRPEDLGLPDYGGRRRVPGLRREELAQLAGVSAGYYTRLEQGQSPNASDAVLDALARVLGLDEAEHAHLRGLARPRAAVRRRPRPETLQPATRILVDSMSVPALVIGRYTSVLAWNRAGHALLAGHLPFESPSEPTRRPNVARLVFLDRHTRELYADWHTKARDAVADLRLIAGRHPDDPELAALIGELTVNSPEFGALWAAHPVHTCVPQREREFRHPVVGSLTLYNELLALSHGEDQRLAVFTAEPDSPSAAALQLLDGLRARGEAPGRGTPGREAPGLQRAGSQTADGAPGPRRAAPGR